MKKFFWFLTATATVMAFSACSSESDESCLKGETKCDGGKAYSCTIDGKWGTGKDCSASAQICDTMKGCIGCKVIADCKDKTKPVCDVISNTCVATNMCIPSEKSCKNELYSECNSTGTALTEIQCGVGDYVGKPTCDLSEKCIGCIENEDCKDPLKSKCSPDNKCVFCIEGAATCEGDIYKECNKNGTITSTQCGVADYDTKPLCDLSEKCIACRNNEDCKDSTKTKCSPNNECLFCIPGSTTCEGDVYTECNKGGMDTTLIQCGVGDYATRPLCNPSAKCIECDNNDDCKDPLKPKCSLDSKCTA